MTTSVKGLLKGLRYISQIFDEKEEDEIQIGHPTDVKHVAHIGWDGPSANAPTWMTEFKAAPEPPSEVVQSSETTAVKSVEVRNIKEKSRHHSTESQTGSPTRKSSEGAKPTRRHRSSDPSSDGSTRDSATGTRHTRRPRNSNNGAEAPSKDAPAVPKQNRRRKTKTTSADGSVKSPRSSKGGSMTDIPIPENELIQ